MQTVEIREARADELEAAGRVTQAAWREFERPGDPLWADYFELLGDAAARAARALVLVAVEEGAVVGTATVELEATIEQEGRLDPEQATFRMLAVEPAWRGRGIGLRLVEECVERARSAGKTVATLHTGDDMAAATAIYRSLGFRRDRAGDMTIAPGVTLRAYRLPLVPAAPAAPAVGTEWGRAWVMKGCVFPVGLLYDVEHDLWARTVDDGVVRIGLTDVGQTAGGKMQVVSFPRSEQRLGTHVVPGKTVALLESAKWLGPIRLPVPGELVEANELLREHPLWVNLEPYGRGWVVGFRPDGEIPWLSGPDAAAAYRERLRRTFRSVAGVNDDFWCVHCNDWDDL